MAEITIKRMGEIQRTIFKILLDNREGLAARKVLESVEAKLPLSEFEKSFYPNNPDTRRFEKIARFSTIGPVKAGWLQKNKGVWSITDEGQKAYEMFPDPEAFMREAGRLYNEWKSNQSDEPFESSPTSKLSEKQVDNLATTLEEAQESSWSEIQKYLSLLPPYDFQNLVVGLLEALSYHVVWVAPPGKDGGIDIVAHTDPLGTSSPRIKVQVKRRQDKVSVEELRAFLATLGDQDVGIFISLGGFTTDAGHTARAQEKRRISLIDLGALFDLWVENYSKIPEQFRRLLPLRPIYFLNLKD